MKKIYLLATAVAFAFSANAQFTDNLDSYATGPMGANNTAVWSVWSGTPSGGSAEDIIVSSDNFFSQPNSGLIEEGAAAGGPQDALLLLGNQTSGIWTVQFQMFIPSGKGAYFNIQGETENGGAGSGGSGVFNSGNIVFNTDGGAPGEAVDDNGDQIYSYFENSWIEVKIEFDLDATPQTYTMKIGDSQGTPTEFSANGDTTLGGIDLFSNNDFCRYFVDNVVFVSGQLGVDDFSADKFSAYPNPVVDVLNIQSAAAVESVVIYDVLGKVVLTAQPEAISPRVDMSSLPSGAYMVNVTINGTSKTIKVIK